MAAATLAVVVLACCATTVPYSKDAEALQTGTVTILLSSTAPRLSVVLDGRVLVDKRLYETQRVDVVGVPAGQHTIRVFTENWQLSRTINYEATVEVKPGDTNSIPIEVPPRSQLYWVFSVGLIVLEVVPVIVVSLLALSAGIP